MTNKLKWILTIIILVIVGLIIWLAVSNRQTVVVVEDDTKRQQEALLAPNMFIEAFNQTQNLPAGSTNARPQDVIVFTLVAENKLPVIYPGFVIETTIDGVVSGATLIDAGGASYHSDSQKLVWTPLDIGPNQAIRKSFSVRVNSLTAGGPVPVLRAQYNNTLQISVGNPTIAGTDINQATEKGVYEAPEAGVAAGLNIVLALASMVGFSAWQVTRKKLN